MVVKSHIKKGKYLVCGIPIKKVPEKAEIMMRGQINLYTMSQNDKDKIHKKCVEMAEKEPNAIEDRMSQEKEQLEGINRWIMNDEHQPTKTYEKGTYNFSEGKYIVYKVFEAGLYYHTNHGYLRWDEMYKEEVRGQEQNDKEIGKPNPFARNRILNSQLDSVIFDFERGNLRLNPTYQRGKIWELSDKQALIRSVLDEIAIGRFAYRLVPYPKNVDYKAHVHREIVDGKQRFSTLYEFMHDQFTIDGFVFSQLHFSDQYKFHGLIIPVIEGEYETEQEVMEWFIALNTMGKPQNPQHLEAIKQELEK